MDLRSRQARRELRAASGSSGFTLIEIVVAILILSGSLVVILGLNFSAMDRTYRDRNRQQAMLLARSIMAAIEENPDMAVGDDRELPAYELAKDLLADGFECDGESCQNLDPAVRRMQALLQVEEIPIPLAGQEPIIMKRVILRLRWGSSSQDMFEVVYFILGDNK